jgi:hypothetical protein
LPPIPKFGDSTGKGTFSLVSSINKFLFSSLSDRLNGILGQYPELTRFLESKGLKYEKDLVSLNKKPVALSQDEILPRGLFRISIDGVFQKNAELGFQKDSSIRMSSVLTEDTKSVIAQKVTVVPGTKLIVSIPVVDTDPVFGTFNAKTISFTTQGTIASIKIQAPILGGKYMLTSTKTPFPLIIEVPQQKIETPSPVSSVAKTIGNTIVKLFNNFFNLFK